MDCFLSLFVSPFNWLSISPFDWFSHHLSFQLLLSSNLLSWLPMWRVALCSATCTSNGGRWMCGAGLALPWTWRGACCTSTLCPSPSYTGTSTATTFSSPNMSVTCLKVKNILFFIFRQSFLQKFHRKWIKISLDIQNEIHDTWTINIIIFFFLFNNIYCSCIMDIILYDLSYCHWVGCFIVNFSYLTW